MNKIAINQVDRIRLKADIKGSLIFGLLFCVALILIVGIIPSILFLFGKSPTNGFLHRSLYILGLLFLPFLVISWANILKHIDLKRGNKIQIQTQDYEIKKKKHTVIITTRDPNKQKIESYHNIFPFINQNQKITIEFAPLSKTLLFISHDKNNFLEIVETKKQ